MILDVEDVTRSKNWSLSLELDETFGNFSFRKVWVCLERRREESEYL